MASIEDLPAPFPLLIFKLLPDLKAVDALRRSCPLFAAVFALHAAELLEHFLQHSTMSDDVAVEMRACILLLVEKCPPQNKGEFRALYRRARIALPRTTPVSAISKVLRRLTLAHSLSRAIVKLKLDLLYDLLHEHRKCPASLYERATISTHLASDSPYALRKLTVPYWSEEQRLVRAVLRLHMFHALGNPDYFPWFPSREGACARRQWQNDEIEDVMESIETLQANSPSCFHLPTISWEGLASGPAPVDKSSASRGDLWWGHDYRQFSQRLKRPSRGHNWFHGTCLTVGNSPLRDADWRVFRRLGLGLWEHRRLVIELELFQGGWRDRSLEQRYVPFLTTSDLFDAWKCLYETANARARITKIESASVLQYRTIVKTILLQVQEFKLTRDIRPYHWVLWVLRRLLPGVEP